MTEPVDPYQNENSSFSGSGERPEGSASPREVLAVGDRGVLRDAHDGDGGTVVEAERAALPVPRLVVRDDECLHALRGGGLVLLPEGAFAALHHGDGALGDLLQVGGGFQLDAHVAIIADCAPI